MENPGTAKPEAETPVEVTPTAIEEGRPRAALFFGSLMGSAAGARMKDLERRLRHALPIFWLAALFVTGCVVAGNRASGRDTLLERAPTDTAFYAHASTREAARRLMAPDAEAPFDIHPTEAAYVLRTSEPGKHYLLLAWTGLLGPSKAERASLDAKGAAAFDSRTFVVGGELAPAAGSLAKDEDVALALKHARTVTRITAYAKFDTLSPLVAPAPTPAAGLSALGRVVMQARLNPDGSFVMHAEPVQPSDTHPFGRWPWKPITHPSRAEDVAVATKDARLVIHSPDRDFSAFDLLFGQEALAGVAADPNANAKATIEAGNLRAVLDEATTLSLSERDGRQRLFVHLPTVGPEAVKLRLSQYLSVAWPKRIDLVLPDKTVTSELSRNEDLYQYVALPDTPYAETVALEGTKKLLIGSDGARGTVLGTDSELYGEMYYQRTPQRTANKAECPIVGTKWISMTVSPQDIPTPLWPYFRVTHVIIHSDVDTLVEFCGYTVDSVDKSVTN